MSDPVIKSFLTVAEEWYAEESVKPEHRGLMPSPVLVYQFANWLDKFQFLDARLQVTAMLASREIDREVLSEFIELVGKEKATEVIQRITGKYRRDTSQPISE